MQDSLRSIVPLKVVAAGATDIGRARKHNEDAVLLRTDLQLYVLADGAGGHNAGNVASALATTSIANYLEETAPQDATRPEIDAFGLHTDARRLATAIQGANRDIIEIANSSNRRKGMGSTVVAALVVPDSSTLHVAHVGDSRCYRLRDGHLELLTFDHSLIHDVLEMRPDLDDGALAKLPRHVVTRALGMEEQVRVSVRTHAILPGDRYLLCSDGLTDTLEPEQIIEVVRLQKTPEEIVALLIDLANNQGGTDNIAAVVIACDMGQVPVAGTKPSSLPRPRKAPSIPPPEVSVSPEDSPEIVMLTTDSEPEIEFESPIHVVPAASADAGMIDALEDLFGAEPRSASKPRTGTRTLRCGNCGRSFDGELDACPHCGTERVS